MSSLTDVPQAVKGRPRWWTLAPLLAIPLLLPLHGVLGSLGTFGCLAAAVWLARADAAELRLGPRGFRLTSRLTGAIAARWDDVSECQWVGRQLVLTVGRRTIHLGPRYRPWPYLGEAVETAVQQARARPPVQRLSPDEVADGIGLRPGEVIQFRRGYLDFPSRSRTLAVLAAANACYAFLRPDFLDMALWLAAAAVVAYALERRTRPSAVTANANGLMLRFGRRLEFVPWSAVVDVNCHLDMRITHDGGTIVLPSVETNAEARRLATLCGSAAALRFSDRPAETVEAVPATALSRMGGDEPEAQRGISLAEEEPRA